MIPILDEIKKQRIKTYHVLTFPLDSARSDFELYITGGYLYVLSLTGTASIRINELAGDSIDLFKNREIFSPFYRLFLTNTAQAGLTLVLAIGVQSDYFQIRDFTAPDLSLMSGYTQQLRDSHAYNYGTQVSKSNTVTAGTVVIYTVTAGKTLLLEHYNTFVFSTGGGIATLIVTNAADATQYAISYFDLTTVTSGFSHGSLTLSIPEGWKIKITSSNASCMTAAYIKGREI